MMKCLFASVRRICWRNPAAADVVVFDREGGDFLARTVLADIPHQIMLVRGERYFFGWRVLLAFFAGLRRIDWNWIWHDPRGSLRAIPGELYKIYLWAYLSALAPKTVLTFIDNNWHFMWLSRNYPQARFYAIQNGVRSALNLIDEVPPKPHFAHVMNMPALFCFGEYERDFYTRLEQRVDEFIPIGSLRADWYRLRIAPQPAERLYDLCLISQWLIDMLDGGPAFPDIQQSLLVLDDYLVRYLDETGVRLCIALRSSDPRERNYFERVYGSRAVVVERDPVSMASYRAIDQSEVALAMDSTILREAYGWGKKTLFCNYSGNEVNRSSPVVDLCYLDTADYEQFSRRLNLLRGMTQEHYRDIVSVNAHYLMRHDPSAASFEKIREKLNPPLPK